MSGHLKKSKISCFLIEKLVIYQHSFVLFLLPNVVRFLLFLPQFVCSYHRSLDNLK